MKFYWQVQFWPNHPWGKSGNAAIARKFKTAKAAVQAFMQENGVGASRSYKEDPMRYRLRMDDKTVLTCWIDTKNRVTIL